MLWTNLDFDWHFRRCQVIWFLLLVLWVPLQQQYHHCVAGNTVTSDSCQDEDKSCSYLASVGECEANPEWMTAHCAKSCGHCTSTIAINKDDDTGTDLGVAQWLPSVEIRKTLQEGRRYVQVLQKECRNRHERCAIWAWEGECQANPAYMNSKCRRSCVLCRDQQ